ncbi:unnamed protein product [Rotaria socialis]|uniref:Potassium channel domain-containing protein n=1 Tax=Rotaria socialis TaxID=392032 RepID=A0A820L8W2_9BILA|nr:unnamed protein product [Rotaria socialis]
MIATRLTLKRYSDVIFHRSKQATTTRPSPYHPRHHRATKIPAHDISFIDNDSNDNFEDVDETTKKPEKRFFCCLIVNHILTHIEIKLMHFVFNPSEKNHQPRQLSAVFAQPNRLSALTYSNLLCKSTSDLTVDLPFIYAIPQQRRSETNTSVIFALGETFNYSIFPSSYDGQPNDSGNQLTILKPGPGSVSIERTRKGKFRHALRTVSKVAFSQLGLGCLVVGYVILGGLIFDAIESRYELEHLEEKEKNRQHFVDQLYSHAYREFNRVLNQTFELKYALWRGGISRHDEHNNGWQIDVESDLWKRLIDYELLQYFGAEEKTQYGNDQQQQEQNTVEVWTFSSAMLYSATVITTIGYGNITPKTTEGKIATMIYAMLGIPLMFMCLTYTGDLLADAFITGYSKIVNFLCRRLCRRHLRSCLSLQGGQSLEQTENEREETRHVPIVATLGVLALYIAMGAFLFARWENWHVLDGAYFCFITFTTIGFGDLVPGKGTLAESKAGKAAICAIFLLFGMIVMAMSFKLMQDEIMSKFRKIARRFGIIKQHTQDPSSSNLG